MTLQPGFAPKVIFLDRDGIINERVIGDYVRRWEDFKFLPGAIAAIRLFKEKGYALYVITNQAGVGRGLMGEESLQTIHKNMQAELVKNRAGIDGIYYCPHKKEDGCPCRKPKPGMLLKAAEEHGIRLENSLFIGDDDKDMQAGQNAGCQTILLKPPHTLLSIAQRL